MNFLTSLFSRIRAIIARRRTPEPEPRESVSTPMAVSSDVGTGDCSCGKEPIAWPAMVTVLGRKVILGDGPTGRCRACVEKELNRVSTQCAICGDPIIPGTLVARAPADPPFPHPYACDSYHCSPPGAQCGVWMHGRLEPFRLGDYHDSFRSQKDFE